MIANSTKTIHTGIYAHFRHRTALIVSKSFFNKAKCKGGDRKNHGIKRNKIDKMAFLTLFECVLSVSLKYKSKRGHVPKYTHFSDYWLRTSVVIHVYKARARRNGHMMFISVYILC